jgi:glycosyltransferase involved in cell wall biosynthesis
MHKKLKAMAGPTIKFVVGASNDEVDKAVISAKAFLFPQEEDFGIVQIHALAAGTPVIGYAKGGALDVIKDGKTGLLFNDQTIKGLVQAIKLFENMQFNHKEIQKYAQQFSEERFIKQVQDFVATAWNSHKH